METIFDSPGSLMYLSMIDAVAPVDRWKSLPAEATRSMSKRVCCSHDCGSYFVRFWMQECLTVVYLGPRRDSQGPRIR